MAKDRFKFMAAVFLVLEKEGKFLLLRRFNTGYRDGQYSMVAGHVDGGETMTAAMVREAREEVGLTVTPEDLKVVHVIHRPSEETDGTYGEYIDFYFTAKRYTGEIRNMEPEKCDELAWFAPAELPDNTIGYIRQALKNIQAGVAYSEYDWNDSTD